MLSSVFIAALVITGAVFLLRSVAFRILPFVEKRRWVKVGTALLLSSLAVVSPFVFSPFLVSFIWLFCFSLIHLLLLFEVQREYSDKFTLVMSLLITFALALYLRLSEREIVKTIAEMEDSASEVGSEFLKNLFLGGLFYLREFFVRQREIFSAIVGVGFWISYAKDDVVLPDSWSVCIFMVLVPVLWVLSLFYSLNSLELPISIMAFLLFRIGVSGLFVLSFLLRSISPVKRWILIISPLLFSSFTVPYLGLVAGVSLMHYWIFLKDIPFFRFK